MCSAWEPSSFPGSWPSVVVDSGGGSPRTGVPASPSFWGASSFSSLPASTSCFPLRPASGAVGSWLGSCLVAGLGGFGSLFLLATLTILLLVGTLGWNPLLPVGRGAVQGAGLMGKGAQRAGTGIKGWVEELAEHRRNRLSAQKQEMETPEESDLFSFVDEMEEEEELVPEDSAAEGSGEIPDEYEVEDGFQELDDPHPA